MPKREDFFDLIFFWFFGNEEQAKLFFLFDLFLLQMDSQIFFSRLSGLIKMFFSRKSKSCNIYFGLQPRDLFILWRERSRFLFGCSVYFLLNFLERSTYFWENTYWTTFNRRCFWFLFFVLFLFLFLLWIYYYYTYVSRLD